MTYSLSTEQPCYTDRNGWELDPTLTKESFHPRLCDPLDHLAGGPSGGQWAWICADHGAGGYADTLIEADAMAWAHQQAVEALISSGHLSLDEDPDLFMHELHVWQVQGEVTE